MKICIAQIKPTKGNIAANIEKHKRYVQEAIKQDAHCIFFPELSITAYEPHLAKSLAIEKDDPRFDVFQILADTHQITIGLGLPLKNKSNVHISMMILKPSLPRQFYSKKYLHVDEEPFFKKGQNTVNFIQLKEQIAIAICYEISIAEHAAAADQSGAKIYLASVAKTQKGVINAHQQLSSIAKRYAMTTLMVNAIGPSDNFINAGQSAIWNNKGVLLEKLSEDLEGLLVLDTKTHEISTKQLLSPEE